MFYGVSYYPEHKNPQEMEHDIELIAASGINTVRMGEFAWCRFEPSEGSYQFAWLDEAIEKLGKQGIKTIICTPTACPPAWLVSKHSSILYTDNRGIVRPFGGRRHYCYNNETYRAYSVQIAEKIAEHYGKNPYVAGFQIDNEPAQEGTGRCHCPTCTKKFQTWLQAKYKTIEAFNERSGSVFWSQEYTDFSQIPLPVNTIEVGAVNQINAFYENPTIRLDFERFSSESQIEYQDLQTDILRKHTAYPVTTNATGLATNSINNYQSTRKLDCYAFDYYPDLRDARVDSFPYAFARGVKSGKACWILEFMSGGGHRLSGSGRLQPNPDALEQATVQAFAHGAEMLLHFQFRTFPFGAEQLNYAIVDMDGVPRRRYYEMKKTAESLKKLTKYEAASFCNEAAVCVDYDSLWALRIKPVNDPVYKYLDYCGTHYHALEKWGVNADVISLSEDFNRYKLLVLPSAFVLQKEMREKLKDFVKSGGTLVATFLTGVKNADNVGYTEILPAGLTDLFGVAVEEVEPVFEKNRNTVNLKFGTLDCSSTDGMWSELLSGVADKIGVYKEDYKSGQGVISRHSYGKGTAYYIGTGLDDEVLCALLKEISAQAGLTPAPFSRADKVEIIRRKYQEKNLFYLFNFSGSAKTVCFEGSLFDCLEETTCAGERTIEPRGYAVLKEL